MEEKIKKLEEISKKEVKLESIKACLVMLFFGIMFGLGIMLFITIPKVIADKSDGIEIIIAFILTAVYIAFATYYHRIIVKKQKILWKEKREIIGEEDSDNER